MNYFSNYLAALLLFVLAFMYLDGSRDVEFHLLSIRFGSYVDHIEKIVAVGSIFLGFILLLAACLLILEQYQLDATDRSSRSFQIFVIGMLSFGIIWMDVQFLHLLVYSFVAVGILIMGSLALMLGLYWNKKL